MRNTFASLTVASKLDVQSDKERLRIILGDRGADSPCCGCLWLGMQKRRSEFTKLNGRS